MYGLPLTFASVAGGVGGDGRRVYVAYWSPHLPHTFTSVAGLCRGSGRKGGRCTQHVGPHTFASVAGGVGGDGRRVYVACWSPHLPHTFASVAGM